jgi:peroxiredoxin 2/4
MKKLLLFVVVAFSVTLLWSQGNKQENRNFRIPLIGENTPSFSAKSTEGTINFPGDYGRSWKILFSHPADFTPVCTSEILELANLQSEFDELDVQVVVVSTDPVDTHLQWKKAMEDLNYKDRQKIKIEFPIVDDEDLTVSKKYGMIHPASNTTKSVRGVFIIDPDNVVQAISFYPFSVGRNTEEIIRMVSALQTTASDKVLTPANWTTGSDVLIPFPPQKDPNNPSVVPAGYYNLAWFMWYKEVN